MAPARVTVTCEAGLGEHGLKLCTDARVPPSQARADAKEESCEGRSQGRPKGKGKGVVQLGWPPSPRLRPPAPSLPPLPSASASSPSSFVSLRPGLKDKSKVTPLVTFASLTTPSSLLRHCHIVTNAPSLAAHRPLCLCPLSLLFHSFTHHDSHDTGTPESDSRAASTHRQGSRGSQ